MTAITLGVDDPRYPPRLRDGCRRTRHSATDAPCSGEHAYDTPTLHLIGNSALLAQPMTALFSSAKCPGHAILRAYDQAAQWRDEGRCIISGFHSPVEQECLRILLRGTSPLIWCPARSLPQRIPPALRPALAAGRLLILSFFSETITRPTTAAADRRNHLIATLADDLWFAHIEPGGRMEALQRQFQPHG